MSTPLDRDGRLVSTRIDVLIVGMCDPGRFKRGRDYARQGAVFDLDVQFGILVAQVQGSRPQPYTVTVRTTPGLPGDPIGSLVPTRREIIFDCTCPDSEEPCKHSVAVMVDFSSRIVDDLSLLATWRGVVVPDQPRATVGSRVSSESRSPTASAAPTASFASAIRTGSATAFSDADRDALEAFLGQPVTFVAPTLPALGPPHGAWDEPWSSMLEDALGVLTNGGQLRR